ncbi:MAG: alkaline phosphatase D family protein [Opitutaceae bacterium]|nr:alkaline phosphatase D family protein [Opitutaceae bacterium]
MASAPPLFPLRGALGMSRRSFLVGSTSFAAAALLANRTFGTVTGSPRLPGYPFTLGIASGDPLPDGFVLWTRLAPRPVEVGGGMPAEPVEVRWEVAEDEAMRRLVQTGTATASPSWAHSVHVEVAGLRPDRWYWYRFRVGGEASPVGRTRTLPAPDAVPERLRFAFASCQKYDTGFYTAYEHMAREDIDLVAHLGDYIYEKADAEDAVRRHGLPTSITLDDYRSRYAAYKSDPALQAMHALVPWIVTWDDHEVTNDYAGPFTKNNLVPGPARDQLLLRRAAGYQAYYEHMPLRLTARPSGPDMLLYRRLAFGRLANFHVLDTRQYRSHWLYGNGKDQPWDPAMLDPARSILGDRQRDWLYRGLSQSPCEWNVLAQQVMMTRILQSNDTYMMDKWTGFEAERRRTLDYLRTQKIRNPVVITGDIHCNWANELIEDVDRLDAPPVATEFAGTSITSGGDEDDTPPKGDRFYAANPFVKFFNGQRGYVHCEVTPQAWRTDFRTLSYVSRPGAPLHTAASYLVESGRPRLNRV